MLVSDTYWTRIFKVRSGSLLLGPGSCNLCSRLPPTRVKMVALWRIPPVPRSMNSSVRNLYQQQVPSATWQSREISSRNKSAVQKISTLSVVKSILIHILTALMSFIVGPLIMQLLLLNLLQFCCSKWLCKFCRFHKGYRHFRISTEL